MLGPMPAYGFYARNARGITLHNVRFQVSSPDLRPALIFDHVEDAAINGLSVEGNQQAESVVRFINSKQSLLTAAAFSLPPPSFCSSKARRTRESPSMAAICPRQLHPSPTKRGPRNRP
jgi:hypothetical protein